VDDERAVRDLSAVRVTVTATFPTPLAAEFAAEDVVDAVPEVDAFVEPPDPPQPATRRATSVSTAARQETRCRDGTGRIDAVLFQ